MLSRRILRGATLWTWSVILTGLSLILGAPSLRSLRSELGRSIYWILGLATGACLIAAHLKLFGLFFLSVVVLIGLFGEWEDLGLSLLASGFFSLLITILLSAGGLALWISRTGGGWKEQILSQLEDWIKPAQSISPSLQVNPYDVMLQLPSILIVLWLAGLYLAVLLERRNPQARPLMQSFRNELGQINFPGAVVWVFILALLAAFGDFGYANVQAVGVNILNISLMLLFFQGLAVIYRFFAVFRVNAVLQIILMIFIVGQLFLLVSLLGLVDHWVDFRLRLSKRREQMNKEAQ